MGPPLSYGVRVFPPQTRPDGSMLSVILSTIFTGSAVVTSTVAPTRAHTKAEFSYGLLRSVTTLGGSDPISAGLREGKLGSSSDQCPVCGMGGGCMCFSAVGASKVAPQLGVRRVQGRGDSNAIQILAAQAEKDYQCGVCGGMEDRCMCLPASATFQGIYDAFQA